ncbi:G patch domain-containing protein 4 isoform X2 [Patella vulgata]|nr:G patch domain-containing protein 4 isoform X2 [Patella vulgata]
MFNKAASSITVDNTEDGVNVKSLVKEEKQEEKKSVLYGNFIKTSTLTNTSDGCEEVFHDKDEDESSEDEDILKLKKYTITDEEMFLICGGRTAHKGARHGLKLNGKLQRIEENEAKMLEELKQRRKDKTIDIEKIDDMKSKKKRKKDKKKDCDEIETMEENEKKSKKICANIEETNDIINEDDEKQIKAKKRKKREKESVNDHCKLDITCSDSKSKSKKKKRQLDCDSIFDELNNDQIRKKKKKNKKKCKDIE